jgi:hypothetical protein
MPEMNHQLDETAPMQEQPPTREVQNTDPRTTRDPMELAALYLRKPIFNSIAHSFSNFLAGFPLISTQRRARFARSAAKRNKDWLTQKLLELRASGVMDSLQEYSLRPQFDGFRGRTRRDTPGRAVSANRVGARG